ncbi:MAG: hypothetical protein OSA95_06095 [Opitutales bacterium]|nr:hypothetical protein [Opitutales bacterium]
MLWVSLLHRCDHKRSKDQSLLRFLKENRWRYTKTEGGKNHRPILKGVGVSRDSRIDAHDPTPPKRRQKPIVPLAEDS